LQIVPQPEQAERVWRFELRPALPAAQVPAGLTLTLLTEDLQPFEGNQVTAGETTEVIFIDVELAPGEGMVWATSPGADQYEPELLRF
jgi:hypothetical protein